LINYQFTTLTSGRCPEGDEPDVIHEARSRTHPLPEGGSAGTAIDDDTFHPAEVHLMEGGQHYCIMGWTREQIGMGRLNQYPDHVQFVQSMR